MPHLSRASTEAMGAVRGACADATTAAALAERVLAILQPVIAFDGAEILALDPDALVLTRVLAHRGGRLADLAFFLREVYLLTTDSEWLDARQLLREGRGAGAFHERFERWIRAECPAMSQAAFTRLWRRLGSPPGGGLRYGLACHGRWVALLQAARWQPGPGFRASDLELLDQIAPTLSSAIRDRLLAGDLPSPDSGVPGAGHLMLNHHRRLVAVDASADAWLARLPDDGLTQVGSELPVAAQSVVNHVGGSSIGSSRCHVVDRHGVAVEVVAQRARPHRNNVDSASQGSRSMEDWCSVTLAAAGAHADHPSLKLLTNRQRQVATAVASGLTDKQIAAQLGIAATTVHDSVAVLHRRLGTGSRAALVARLRP